MNSKFIEYGILIAATLAAAWTISFLSRKALTFYIQRNSNQLHADPTNFIFLKNSVSFICFSFGLFWIFSKIPYFNSLGTALFAGAGVLAAVIGFASQKAFSNIIAGIFILIFKPFRVGDAIEVSNNRKGVVEEITLRHTVIRDYEYRRVVVPNNIMSDDTIINNCFSDKKIRKFIEIGIAYDADMDLAEQIIKDEIRKHPLCLDNRTDQEKEDEVPVVPIKLVSLGDYSITLRAFAWTNDYDSALALQWDVLKSIKKAFDRAGIEIPYPYQTLVLKNDLSAQQDAFWKNQKKALELDGPNEA